MVLLNTSYYLSMLCSWYEDFKIQFSEINYNTMCCGVPLDIVHNSLCSKNNYNEQNVKTNVMKYGKTTNNWQHNFLLLVARDIFRGTV